MCTVPSTYSPPKLTTLEEKIHFAAPKLTPGEIKHFLEEIQKRQWAQDAYFPAKNFGWLRSVQVWDGKLLIHLNKKKKGDRIIGSGYSSHVHLAIAIATGELLAIKRLHLHSITKTLYKREIGCLERFASASRIIPLIFATRVIGKDRGLKGFLAFPFFEQGDLASGIAKVATALNIPTISYQEGEDLTSFLRTGVSCEITTCFMPGHQRRIVYGLLNALFEIHKEGYVHRDVKPENVLIEKREGQFHGILCDLGFCTKMTDAAANAFAGTEDYCSPEDAKYYLEHGKMPPACAANDMWALGCILWQMLWLCPPIWFIDPRTIRDDKMYALVDFEEDLAKGLLSLRASYSNNPVVLLMCDLLEPATKRPTAEKALQVYGDQLTMEPGGSS